MLCVCATVSAIFLHYAWQLPLDSTVLVIFHLNFLHFSTLSWCHPFSQIIKQTTQKRSLEEAQIKCKLLQIWVLFLESLQMLLISPHGLVVKGLKLFKSRCGKGWNPESKFPFFSSSFFVWICLTSPWQHNSQSVHFHSFSHISRKCF